MDTLGVALLLVHELSHSGTAESIYAHQWGATEIYAFVAMQQFLKKELRAGSITPEEYAERMAEIRNAAQGYGGEVGAVVARAETMMLSAAFMPEMHQHADSASMTYRGLATPFYQGLWGLQVNPNGPVAPPARAAQ